MSNTAQLLLFEKTDLISSTTVNGVLYGIASFLFVLSTQSHYTQLRDPHQRRQSIFMVVYASVVVICGIINLAFLTHATQLAYIDHNHFPGESLEYLTNIFNQSIGIGQDISNVMVDILTLGIQLWRLWVIYHATGYATVIAIIPLLLLIGFIASDTGRRYIGIAAMLIESYALESTCLLQFCSSSISHKCYSSEVLTIIRMSAQIVAYLLVIYRVSMGRAWDKQTGRQITRSLRFNHDTGHTAQTTSLETTITRH
ncbi:hypothetical protein P691DRAFT_680932 [Macrolepiota fuliginosa MF-IS2]|uniref:Uncharacterized protein n=1 Tax=Macrolepiota fuliginosa MF-IS2 TaxID=1400762 RepID=A0A9P6BWB4_9AGAR|nr:hypothetical protein P691DRAFT_680932 [Macrolepiota fuliginosa MF-IS2]